MSCKLKYEYDDDEDYVPTKKVKYSLKDDLPAKVKKHTLDSDEEEEDDDHKDQTNRQKKEFLDDEDIDGQEDATIEFEGETKITPFNMKEEMEEGHFDKEGFYHFKKDSELLKDAWMDDIDWVKVKQREGHDDLKKYGSDIESDPDEEIKLPAGLEEKRKDKENEMNVYKDILALLKPEENIAKALKRLGGRTKKLTSVERWKLKKQGKLDTNESGHMADFSKLTDLANTMVENGNMNIYEETFEVINLKVKNHEASVIQSKSQSSFDMFSDDVATTESTTAPPASEGNTENDLDDVMWVYKEKDEEESKIHGPFSTHKMIHWRDTGYFKDGVYVRKATEKNAGRWYHSSRMQFDLYI